jgi:hypothetical protein
MEENERRFTSMLTDVVRDAAVYQGGGAEVDGTTFKDKLQTAFESSLKRLFPSFAVGDHPEWDKVFTRAVQGNAEALKAVGHAGDDGDHMVVREIRKQIPGAQGVSWSAVRKTFESAPYGWPRDTIDGAVAVLVSSGLVSARRGDAEIRGKDLVKQQANATTLATEGVVVTKPEWLAARKPFILLDGAQPTDDYVRAEARNLVHRLIDLVAQAGGEPPKPLEQLPPYLTDLRHQTGNQLVKSLAAHAVQLEADIKKWQAQADLIKHRMGAWELTEELARHAERLEAFAGIRAKLDAIRDNRQLLGNPDPLPPVADDLANALREAVTERIDRFELKLETGIAALKGKEVWLRLPEEEQTRILANPSLRPYQRPSLSGPRDLHDALNQRSLAQWDAVIDALPERLSQAELEAIRVLKPKVKEVVLDKPLMEKPADVERWIEQTRETLLELVSDGQPVRIK